MENEQQKLYLVETTEAVSYIVEPKFLHIMLVESVAPEDLVILKYADKLNWHLGDDKRIYEEFKLNKKGAMFYDAMDIAQRAPRFVQAINEMNENKNRRNLCNEKAKLKEYLSVNEIFSISTYEEKEFGCTEKQTTKATSPKI